MLFFFLWSFPESSYISIYGPDRPNLLFGGLLREEDTLAEFSKFVLIFLLRLLEVEDCYSRLELLDLNWAFYLW
jgi:hypothetical protein